MQRGSRDCLRLCAILRLPGPLAGSTQSFAQRFPLVRSSPGSARPAGGNPGREEDGGPAHPGGNLVGLRLLLPVSLGTKLETKWAVLTLLWPCMHPCMVELPGKATAASSSTLVWRHVPAPACACARAAALVHLSAPAFTTHCRSVAVHKRFWRPQECLSLISAAEMDAREKQLVHLFDPSCLACMEDAGGTHAATAHLPTDSCAYPCASGPHIKIPAGHRHGQQERGRRGAGPLPVALLQVRVSRLSSSLAVRCIC